MGPRLAAAAALLAAAADGASLAVVGATNGTLAVCAYDRLRFAWTVSGAEAAAHSGSGWASSARRPPWARPAPARSRASTPTRPWTCAATATCRGAPRRGRRARGRARVVAMRWLPEDWTMALEFDAPTNAPPVADVAAFERLVRMNVALRAASFRWDDGGRTLVVRVNAPGDAEAIAARFEDRSFEAAAAPWPPPRPPPATVEGERGCGSPSLASTARRSLAFWIYVAEEPSGAHRGVFFKGDVGRLGGARTPSAWLLPDSNRLALRVSTHAGGDDVGADTELPLPTYAWTHVVFSFANRTANPEPRADGRLARFVFGFYVDGRRDSTLDFYDDVAWNDGALHLGRDPDRRGFRGAFADAAAFPFAADPAAAAALHAAALATFPPEARDVEHLAPTAFAPPKAAEDPPGRAGRVVRDARAAMALSKRYREGRGVAKSVEAAAWYARAAAAAGRDEYHTVGEQTHVELDRLSDERFDDGSFDDGQRGDDDAAIQAQMLRAEAGDVDALVASGDLLYWGARGGPPDHAAAVAHYEAAAAAGSAKALNGLGYEYFYGHTLDQNATKAFGYFSEAARLDADGDSNFNAAHCLATGTGVARDGREAAVLYERAATRHGHFDAAFELALVKYEGRGGVARDPARALDFFDACARAGWAARDVRAGFDAFLAGDGAAALLWYAEAAEVGFEVAAANAAWLLDRDGAARAVLGAAGPAGHAARRSATTA
ncbi:hypothetical protein JL722_9374 [Aureococcus anophagefferens]|nr:hypothetical protein JL722_9374 [Aureococcus anophagefferens]